jgi:hypothetical protein
MTLPASAVAGRRRRRFCELIGARSIVRGCKGARARPCNFLNSQSLQGKPCELEFRRPYLDSLRCALSRLRHPFLPLGHPGAAVRLRGRRPAALRPLYSGYRLHHLLHGSEAAARQRGLPRRDATRRARHAQQPGARLVLRFRDFESYRRNLVLRSALLRASRRTATSENRANAHPSRRRFAPPQDEVCGF